jgi:hypothetical protein
MRSSFVQCLCTWSHCLRIDTVPGHSDTHLPWSSSYMNACLRGSDGLLCAVWLLG